MNLNNRTQSFIQSHDFSLSLDENGILFLKIYLFFFYHNHANQVGFIEDRVYFHKYKRITSVFVIWRSGIAIKRTKLSDSTSIFEFEGNLSNPLILGYFIIVIYIYKIIKYIIITITCQSSCYLQLIGRNLFISVADLI